MPERVRPLESNVKSTVVPGAKRVAGVAVSVSGGSPQALKTRVTAAAAFFHMIRSNQPSQKSRKSNMSERSISGNSSHERSKSKSSQESDA